MSSPIIESIDNTFLDSSKNALLHSVIKASHEAILLVESTQQNICLANQAACDLLGYTQEQLEGQSLTNIECSLQDIFFWDELRATPCFEGARIIEGEWLTQSGTTIAIEKRVSCFFDGNDYHWIIYVQDLSQRKKVEEEQIQLTSQIQTSLEATAEGILVTNLEGRVSNYNRQFADLWAIPDELLATHDQSEVLQYILNQLNDGTEFSNVLNYFQHDRELETETILETVDHRYLVCVSKPQILRDWLMGRVYSFRDITAMKNAERDLILARDTAEAASQVKSQFLSQMSHELRTPLNAIIGFAQLLELESNSSNRVQLATIARAGKHLLNVINEILDVSKIEAGKIEVECIPFSPLHILTEVCNLVASPLQEKGLKLNLSYEFPLPTQIHSDPTRFRQILLNLCTNALKYTDAGEINIHVSYVQKCMTFAIRDTGIGISEEQQKKLFSAFSQADSSTTRKYGGTGLGLYISFQLAQMLGGTISLQSTPNIGSTFSFSLINRNTIDADILIDSLENINNTTPNLPTINAMIHLKGCVLLAEDNIDNQQLFTAYMQRAGITVTVVENGSLAIEKALSEDFDLILMDMQMPVMGGLEATTLLRQAAYAQPIVALTANVMKEDIESYLAAGCTDYMSKPIERNAFFTMLAQYLEKNDGNEVAQNKSIHNVMEGLDFYQELTEKFKARLPQTLADIEQQVMNKDWHEVEKIVHNLKGTAGQFGCPETSRLAALLSTELRQINRHGGTEISPILDAWGNLKVEIEKQLNNH